jgi:hypothetical protein
MKILAILLLCASSLSYGSNQEIQEIKQSYEEKTFEIKLEMERELISLKNKSSFELPFTKSLPSPNAECIQFVYQGPSSREESARACSGVSNMECVRFVYQGAASREESARACAGVIDMECVRFVYQGPSSREESARQCGRGGRRPDRC